MNKFLKHYSLPKLNKKDIDIFKKEEDLFSKDINDEAPEIGNEILQ